jgi:hypothetical protein
MRAVLVHKDNPDVCSDPTLVSPGGTRVAARKDKEKALSKEGVLLKVRRPVETHGDVKHQIKKSRIQGMRSHVTKIEIDAIIAQVSALRKNKDVLIGSLGREGYDAQIVHLLGQLPGLPKKNSHGSIRNVGDGSRVGDDFGDDGGGKSVMMSSIASD